MGVRRGFQWARKRDRLRFSSAMPAPRCIARGSRVIPRLFISSRTSKHIFQKFGGRFGAGHKQMIAGTGTGHIEQVPLRAVNILKVTFVGNSFDALLKRNHLIIAGHHANSPELQSLWQGAWYLRTGVPVRSSTCSSRTRYLIPASSAAIVARSIWSAERTNSAIS